MRIVRKHLVVAGAVGLMLAGTGGAVAGALDRPSATSAHDGQLSRTYAFCPDHDRHVIRSTTTGAAKTLVPAGARQVLLCRYTGLGAHPTPSRGGFRLIAHRRVTRLATVNRLAAGLDALKEPRGAVACPSDSGAALIAFFRYRSGSDDPVTVKLGGCSPVTNGHLTRGFAAPDTGRQLIRQLESLTHSATRRSEPYRLYTHCGIEWTRIHGTFWRAVKPLSDGNGNPPPGWGNPFQQGTLTFTSTTTAVFRSAAGSVTFHRTGRTRPPFLCG